MPQASICDPEHCVSPSVHGLPHPPVLVPPPVVPLVLPPVVPLACTQVAGSLPHACPLGQLWGVLQVRQPLALWQISIWAAEH
jgi:hypothetical protein